MSKSDRKSDLHQPLIEKKEKKASPKQQKAAEAHDRYTRLPDDPAVLIEMKKQKEDEKKKQQEAVERKKESNAVRKKITATSTAAFVIKRDLGTFQTKSNALFKRLSEKLKKNTAPAVKRSEFFTMLTSSHAQDEKLMKDIAKLPSDVKILIKKMNDLKEEVDALASRPYLHSHPTIVETQKDIAQSHIQLIEILLDASDSVLRLGPGELFYKHLANEFTELKDQEVMREHKHGISMNRGSSKS